MTNQGNRTNRPLLWEDDPPAELRPRRTREDSPLAGQFRPGTAGRRGGPGMPLEFDDPDGDGVLRPTGNRFAKPKGAWWRPASTFGRVALGVCAATVLGGLITATVMARHYLQRDSRFRIAGSEDIQATGLTEVSRAELLPVFGEDIGRNIFFVPLSARRKQLEKIPWVERATVMRVLPDQIRVAVVERQPVAFTRHGQQIGLVDANGVLLNMSAATMAKRHYSFPVVTGLDPGDSAEGRRERMAVYLRLMSELDAGGKRNTEQISEIDLTDPEDARVLMPEQGADILADFGEDHFLERYERYKAHIAEWRQAYPHLATVDLRYDNQVVLDMASGKQAAAPALGSDATAKASNAAKDDKPDPGVKEKPVSKTASAARPTRKSKPAQAKKRTDRRRTGQTKQAEAKSQAKRSSNSKFRPATGPHPTNKDRSVGTPGSGQGG